MSPKRLKPFEVSPKTLSRDLQVETSQMPSENCLVNIAKNTFVEQKKLEYQSFLPSPQTQTSNISLQVKPMMMT